MKKLAIIITHPIQYYSPLFKLISDRNRIKIKVFYTWEQSKEKVFDKKFGKEIKWDIPLLEGYDYTFIKNIAKNPGSGQFKGVINPSLTKEIENWKADAILVYGWNHQSHFKAMRYFKGKIPVYFRGDSTLLDEKKGVKTILRRIWLKFVYRYIDYETMITTPYDVMANRVFSKQSKYGTVGVGFGTTIERNEQGVTLYARDLNFDKIMIQKLLAIENYYTNLLSKKQLLLAKTATINWLEDVKYYRIIVLNTDNSLLGNYDHLVFEGAQGIMLDKKYGYTLKNLPESIGNLENLKWLNLSSNKLIKVPESIGRLVKLRILKL